MLTTLKSRLPVLSGWLETSLTGELQQRSSAATPVDTVLWEPSSSTCQRPSCSTPSNRSDRGRTWTEVVVRGRKRAPGNAPSGATPSLGALQVRGVGWGAGTVGSLLSVGSLAPADGQHSLSPTNGCLRPSGWTSSIGPLAFVLSPAEAATTGPRAVALPAFSSPGSTRPPGCIRGDRVHRIGNRTGNNSRHRGLHYPECPSERSTYLVFSRRYRY